MSDHSLPATYRILDASANRASEGLRTMEEYARFVLDDSSLTADFKSLRHDLASALTSLPRESLLAARDTEGDVGTVLGEQTEYERQDLSGVIAAAAQRTQQSLRVLEEYGKTVDATLGARIEQVRYRCYTATAKLELQMRQGERQTSLNDARLYVLIDAGASEDAFAQTVTQLARSDIDVLQLRDRSVDDRTLLIRARLGARIAREHQTLFIMNDRCDLAVAADTDGVHVGQEEMPIAEARQIVGPRKLIGLSTHSIEQAREAVRLGADYIGCGPVFPGRTKSFDEYVGTSFLKQVADEIELPAFAIGGIDRSNVDEVIAAGLRRVAVTGAIRDAKDPVEAAKSLQEQLRAP